MHIRDGCTEVGSLELIHWRNVTHICVSKLTIIGADNGLSPGRHQSITWTNAGIVFAGLLRTNISETLIEIHTSPCKKMHIKMSFGKWRPFDLGLNMLLASNQHQMRWWICATERNPLSEPFIFQYPYKHHQPQPWCVTLQPWWSIYFHFVHCFVNNRQARNVQWASVEYDMLSGTNGQFVAVCSYK